jgi:ATP-dependent exoDNAse (exonuclease V) alpha subunit
VVVDEASMVSTADLVEIVEQARRAGGKVLLVGDPVQLTAIHIGGVFDLLAKRHRAARLHDIRRFTQPWEADASRLARRRARRREQPVQCADDRDHQRAGRAAVRTRSPRPP